mmetsp:Transcript_82731/g.233837  ORF Transcript_82731/g.233837 Transcript_82731/m.233837 type:complete len:207 (+) Transcript_82731:125-745(+)
MLKRAKFGIARTRHVLAAFANVASSPLSKRTRTSGSTTTNARPQWPAPSSDTPSGVYSTFGCLVGGSSVSSALLSSLGAPAALPSSPPLLLLASLPPPLFFPPFFGEDLPPSSPAATGFCRRALALGPQNSSGLCGKRVAFVLGTISAFGFDQLTSSVGFLARIAVPGALSLSFLFFEMGCFSTHARTMSQTTEFGASVLIADGSL